MVRWLERKLGRFAIPNLTLLLVAGQALTFLVNIAEPTVFSRMQLIPQQVLQGEVWRLFTFIFLAPLIDPTQPLSPVSILFFIIQLQLLWIFGNALDHHWGSFRYNLFLLLGYVATVAASMLVPDMPATNGFIYGTVFLAFARLYPDYILHLLFIFPVKIKWLALLAWVFYGYAFLTGDWMIRLMVAASVLNFILFFGPGIARSAVQRARQAQRQASFAADEDVAFHRCVICGRTEQSDPKLEFRYCPKCTGAPCYCQDHINNHEHR